MNYERIIDAIINEKCTEVEKYFEKYPLHQNHIKSYLVHPLTYNRIISGEIEQYQSDSMKLGSAVDCLLTDSESFFKKFIVEMDENVPVGMMKDLVIRLFNIYKEQKTKLGNKVEINPNDVINNYFETVYNEIGFKRDNLDKVKERFEKEGREYYNFLLESEDKIVLSKEQLDKAMTLSEIIYKDLNYIFEPKENDNIERLFQKNIKWKLKVNKTDITCDSTLDVVHIDHDKKKIRIFDLKYTSYYNNFSIAIKKFRYDIQMSFYKRAVNYLRNNDEKLKSYTIEQPIFIVYSDNYPPCIAKCSDNVINIGENGSKKLGLEGYMNAVKNMMFNILIDNWRYPAEYYIRGGLVVDLNENL